MSSATSSYWCYRCSRFVRVWARETIVCPDCDGGFVEEIDAPATRSASIEPRRRRLPAAMYMLGNNSAGSPIRSENSDLGFRRRSRNSGERSPFNPVIVLRGTSDGMDSGERGSFELYYDDGAGSGLRPLPASMSDFLMGSGFDRLLDQLTQIEINGVTRCEHPPASKAAVDSMPTIEIVANHVTTDLHCAVCKDPFELGSEAREMPCKHIYHQECILPWLSLRNSCPVCRHELPAEAQGRARTPESEHTPAPVTAQESDETVGLTIWRLPGGGFAVGRFSGGRRAGERELPVVYTDTDPCGWKGVTCDPQTKRVIYLSLAYRKLSGFISPDVGKLKYLKLLALHDNNFYGTIPSQLGNCSELKALYLQDNFLSGFIPEELGNLLDLETLDISSNSLSGSIPVSLEKLTKLATLNVSSNFLIGRIPSEGALSKFTEKSFIGNRGLCGNQIGVTCKSDSEGPSANPEPPFPGTLGKSEGSNKKSGTRLLVSASATVGALLLVALMCFWGCFLYKKLGKSNNRSLAIDVSEGTSLVMFHGDLPYSTKDIIKKLETLNDESVVGFGGFGTVYKLAMDDGNVFALKKIVKTNEGLDRFFERELEILGSIKHRYLVNLRGYCNSTYSKLLIYDYLPGGSLDEVLHERSEQLDWDTRLNIIMGAAKGLAYLHHDCSPRIIHRDIKSSNILLDGNLEARVSDFGLAKLLEDEESHKTSLVAGTFGYLAPEYMQSGRATEKTDVYSFGVLILEVLSGKRPTDSSFIEKGLTIVGWWNFLVLEEKQRQIIGGHCEGVQTESLDALLSVAIQCVSSNPEERPTMHRVVQILESEVMTPCPSDFYDSSSD